MTYDKAVEYINEIPKFTKKNNAGAYERVFKET